MSLHPVAITIIVTLRSVAVDQSSTIIFIFFVVHLTIEHHILHIIVTSKFVLEAFVPGQWIRSHWRFAVLFLDDSKTVATMEITVWHCAVIVWLLTLWILSSGHRCWLIQWPVLRGHFFGWWVVPDRISGVVVAIILLTVWVVVVAIRVAIIGILTVVVFVTFLVNIKMMAVVHISVPRPVTRSTFLRSVFTPLPAPPLAVHYLRIAVFVLHLRVLICWFCIVICSLGGLSGIISVIELVHWHLGVMCTWCVWYWGALQLKHLLLRLFPFFVEIEAQAEDDEQ